MVEQFTSMTFSGLTGTNMTRNANGEVTKEPNALITKGGEHVPAGINRMTCKN